MKLSTILTASAIVLTVGIGSANAGTYVESSNSYRRGTVNGRTNFSGSSFVNGERDYGSFSLRAENVTTNSGNKFKFKGSGALEVGNETYGSRSTFNGYEAYNGYETTNTYTTSAGVR